VRSYLDEKVAVPAWKAENTAVGIRHTDHVALSMRKKLSLTSPTRGSRSRTQATEFSFLSGSKPKIRI
jgi:hypothetical protein